MRGARGASEHGPCGLLYIHTSVAAGTPQLIQYLHGYIHTQGAGLLHAGCGHCSCCSGEALLFGRQEVYTSHVVTWGAVLLVCCTTYMRVLAGLRGELLAVSHIPSKVCADTFFLTIATMHVLTLAAARLIVLLLFLPVNPITVHFYQRYAIVPLCSHCSRH